MEMPKKEDRPPEEIWADQEEINAWFAEVEERREAEMSGNAVERPDLDQNEATRGLKERLRG